MGGCAHGLLAVHILDAQQESQVSFTDRSIMALKKSELYSSLWASCDELRGGMDASQ